MFTTPGPTTLNNARPPPALAWNPPTNYEYRFCSYCGTTTRVVWSGNDTTCTTCFECRQHFEYCYLHQCPCYNGGHCPYTAPNVPPPVPQNDIWVDLLGDNFNEVNQHMSQLDPKDPKYISPEQLQNVYSYLLPYESYVAAKGGVLRVPAVRVGPQGITGIEVTTGLDQNGYPVPPPLSPSLIDPVLLALGPNMQENSKGRSGRQLGKN
ncbi:hypothetical protein EV426DRAFT_430531 [Tirmania nivea]|nr:hypothetical protein EV426DRAFT_430531 [Tirmania nivea]